MCVCVCVSPVRVPHQPVTGWWWGVCRCPSWWMCLLESLPPSPTCPEGQHTHIVCTHYTLHTRYSTCVTFRQLVGFVLGFFFSFFLFEFDYLFHLLISPMMISTPALPFHYWLLTFGSHSELGAIGHRVLKLHSERELDVFVPERARLLNDELVSGLLDDQLQVVVFSQLSLHHVNACIHTHILYTCCTFSYLCVDYSHSCHWQLYKIVLVSPAERGVASRLSVSIEGCMPVTHSEGGVVYVLSALMKVAQPLCLSVVVKEAWPLYPSFLMKEAWPLCPSVPVRFYSSVFPWFLNIRFLRLFLHFHTFWTYIWVCVSCTRLFLSYAVPLTAVSVI